MTGFSFANKHSNSFRLAMEQAHRPLLPAKLPNEYVISGRHGTIDFGNETYTTRQIIVDICFIAGNTHDLQTLSRDIALWLSGRGQLIFDDEPQKAYTAVVHESIDTIEFIRTKRASVIFTCQPFAKTVRPIQTEHINITLPQTITVINNGTQPTPIRIIIKNTGISNINGIKIIRRAEI